MTRGNAECTNCGITAADLPWEDLGMADLNEANELLFVWIDGRSYCQGCANSDGPEAP